MIIGTAGHVDHGKTALIKALTGIDTDRLPEEKKREMSIVLGFAFVDLPKSGRVGIIDVPGHEKFLKNMLTGVRGVDVGLLVVAADESVMPQTRVHFEIMRLSKVKKIVIVVTKIDIADNEMVEATIFETRELLENTFYNESPILKVSSVTLEGIDELKNVLDDLVSHFPPKESVGIPILPVDRSFIMKGVGTVVTGTLISGTICEGDDISIYPKNLVSRVRQIQVHNESQKKVDAGHRVALNLVGIERGGVQKGDIISLKNALFPTKLIDAKLELEPGVLLKNWTRVKIYICTGEYIGRIRRLVDGVYSQIVFETPIVTWFGDTFILRNYSPDKLLGGGTVLNPFAKKDKVKQSEYRSICGVRDEGEIEKVILEEIKRNSYVKKEGMRKTLITPDNRFDSILSKLVGTMKVDIVAKYLLSSDSFKELETRIVDELTNLHSQFPLQLTIPKDRLSQKMGVEPELFNSLLRKLANIVIIGDSVKLKNWTPKLTSEQIVKIKKLEELFKDKIEPPPIGIDSELINLLIVEGKLVKIKPDFIIHADVIDKVKHSIREYIEKKGEITISELKQLLGTTRKYAVPLAEYLDSIKFTKRIGDKRVLYEDTGLQHSISA